VGLGLASALASWVELRLLRQRLKKGVMASVESGIVINVLAGASVVAVVALAVRLFAPVPSPIPLLILGPLALGAYIGTLTWLGMGPLSRSPNPRPAEWPLDDDVWADD
jgi:hypothetical protein